jgi:hypothetical protein
MRNRLIALGAVLNSVTLLVGLTAGFFLGTSYSGKVHAQVVVQTPTSPQIQDIAPTVTAPSLGANLLLAHEIQSDSLVVNGYDMLKVNQNILNYLATQLGANNAALQSIVANSRADKLYTIKSPTAAPPPQKPEEKKP